MTHPHKKTRLSLTFVLDAHAIAGDVSVFVSAPLDVRTKLLAAATGNALNGWALARSDRLAVLPLTDARLGYAHKRTKFGLAQSMDFSVGMDMHEPEYEPGCYQMQQPSSCCLSVRLITIRA